MFLGILGLATKSNKGLCHSSWADSGPWGVGATRKRAIGVRYVPTTLWAWSNIYRVR